MAEPALGLERKDLDAAILAAGALRAGFAALILGRLGISYTLAL
jgi:uncharacterized 2Fe-2S/4Fe-4S cluster protein (DUF4445 family)